LEPKTKYEEEILKEVSSLPENLQSKISKIILVLKREMIADVASEKTVTEDFLSVCGKWKDQRSVEEQIEDVSANRKSTNRTEGLL